MGAALRLWQSSRKIGRPPELPLQDRMIGALYREAMRLAEEARNYFDDTGRTDRDGLEPLVRVSLSCESLKVTTRLLHVLAWLLTQRAVQAGELTRGEALDPARRLGEAPVTDDAMLAAFPPSARALITASMQLHRRVALLDAALDAPRPAASPALSMQDRLARVL